MPTAPSETRTHPTEEEIERYALGKVEPAEQKPIETHLLTCQKCCEILEFLDDFQAALRAAAQRSKHSNFQVP